MTIVHQHTSELDEVAFVGFGLLTMTTTKLDS
jgi:hypothetical protein